MENFILGFESDLSEYPMKEILFWILAIGLLHLAIGRFIERRSISKDYFHLIRYSSLKRWWLRLCRKVFFMCAFGIMLLFFVSILFQHFQQLDNELSLAVVVEAYVLYLANITLFSFLTILIINCWNGERICFAAIMLIEIFSMYGGILSSSIACYLPGSLAMYRRSGLHTVEGFQPAVVLAVEIGMIIVIFLFGYKGLERGAKNG